MLCNLSKVFLDTNDLRSVLRIVQPKSEWSNLTIYLLLLFEYIAICISEHSEMSSETLAFVRFIVTITLDIF